MSTPKPPLKTTYLPPRVEAKLIAAGDPKQRAETLLRLEAVSASTLLRDGGLC